ncbi:MAG: putative toxin-antitoxin system toxin component, PIN family, partial [Acidobacteriota bacterium]
MKHSRIDRKKRVVIDTNVWISGIVFGGKPEQVIRYLLDGQAELIISEELIAELRQKMTQRFPDYLTKFSRIEASIRKD